MQRLAFGPVKRTLSRTRPCAQVRSGACASSSVFLRRHNVKAYGTSAATAVQSKPATQPSEQATERKAKFPECKGEDKKVHITWDPWTSSRFQNMWLRDHCRCSECFHEITKQRLVDTFAIPKDIQPLAIESTQEGLKITWPSSKTHISLYPWDWLKWSSYDPPVPNRDQILPSRKREKVLWGAGIVQDPPTVDYEQVINDDRALWKWLTKIDIFGFCFVSGVPVTTEATEALSKKIGNIRKTHYGEFWDFTADLAKGDTAYTNMALPAHTDTTYFSDPCGLQLFHLLSHTSGSGGASLLVDGFYVASILKELHPEAYRVLSTVCIPTHAAGDADILIRPSPSSGYPILRHEAVGGLVGVGVEGFSGGDFGELVQVRYNNDDRSVMKTVSAEVMEEWYDALRKWDKLLKSQDSEYWVQLSPGTAVVLDNHRVLHGRSAFDGKRRMCGAYTGMDDFRSKLAVLTERYESATESTTASNDAHIRSVWSPWF